ncbi:MAG: hypothetical protein DRO11_07080 [Methanobacteriota archaeon]|nr:MAG: hypothetical protein DRO11_07080 [Euryarchaeota archaeon]
MEEEEAVEREKLWESVKELAKAVEADHTMVFSDNFIADMPKSDNIMFVTMDEQHHLKALKTGYKSLLLPIPILESESLFKEAVSYARFRGVCRKEETVLCVLIKDRYFERIHLLKVEETLNTPLYHFLSGCDYDVKVVKAVYDLTLLLSREGLDGEPVGAIFMIGDQENVLKRSSQLSPNPFKEKPASILDKSNWPFIRAITRLDGAFILDERGMVISACTYLIPGSRVHLPPGLGARHMSAAAITKETKALAIVLSETNGKIRLFHKGGLVVEVDPRRTGSLVRD